MTSIRNNERSEDRYLDAARECILATGWTRTTLTDVARRAGVSRMTIYRTWPDMQTLLADLMTREWGGVVAEVASAGAGSAPLERLSTGISRTVTALRSNDLLRKIVEVDLELLEPMVAEGQADGSVRDGDPRLLARSILLAAHGFTLSAETMTDDEHPVEAYDEELRTLLERY